MDRSAVLRALAAAAASGPWCVERAAASRAERVLRQMRPSAVVLPLERCGGAFCTQYAVDGQRFRAVVDTGSPFLLVNGDCVSSRWGCFDTGAGSLSLGDSSEEGYGGQDVGVEWRRGEVSFGAMSFSAPINFGVVRSSVGKGGTQAIYLGLAKDRSPRVRPTLLEQTDIVSLYFDFPRQRLTLARRPLVGNDANAIPLIDLRPLGAPVAPYAFQVHRMIVNGRTVQLGRPAVAVLDTGTTGLVISESLYDSDELALPGAAVREVTVEAISPRGRLTSFRAERSRGQSSNEFPLIVTPVSLPWFDTARGSARRAVATAPTRGRVGALGSAPHVLFLGLAFLSEMQLTIDTDTSRMLAVRATPTAPVR